jgi:DMSO reductase family type II enzyme chaperone
MTKTEITSRSPAGGTLGDVRTALYRFLLRAFDHPSRDQHGWLSSGPFREALDGVCRQFDVNVPAGRLFAAGYTDYEAAYIATFDVGLPAPPIVLLASHYQRTEPAPRIVHEHILFYRRFGMQLAKGNIEQADHLLNELAFLIHLDDPDGTRGIDDESVRCARRDFLFRHTGCWVPQAVERAAGTNQLPIYVALLRLLSAAVAQDLELTSVECS